MYLQNKYSFVYYKIVDRAKSRVLDEYSEKHHIIPESFYKNRTRKGPQGWLDGDPDSSDNIVHLTAREHFICHLLLIKMTEGLAKRKMTYALWNIINGRDHSMKRERYQITSRQYTSIRQSVAKVASETHKGKIVSKETRQRISSSRMGKPTKGRVHTDESRQALRELRSKKCIGPDGTIYNSTKEAGISQGISSVAIRSRIKNQVSGWRYVNPIDQTNITAKKDKAKPTMKGRKWWNNGITQVRAIEPPSNDFINGRL